MFERTRSGQENRAVFLGADIVCYVEGGGGNGDTSPDVTFWSRVFTVTRPDLKIRCVARGGKPILERLARDIVDNNIKSVMVAMDSDYDDYRGRKIVDHRIMYTYGYSLENDLLTFENFVIAASGIFHFQPDNQEIRSFMLSAFDSITIALKRPMLLDFYALCSGSSVLPREAPGRVLTIDALTGLPSVNRSQILKLCSEANQNTRPSRNALLPGPVDVYRYIVGKIFWMAANRILRATAKRFFKSTNVSPDHMRDVLIQTFSHYLQKMRGNIVAYYFQQCAAL
ncbi:DUF4435 domain-containing protein [Mesorhizobium opportunistum]|uniref:DUF4435 domain-containing protein n=1 Tax=Mesorhizobium opportunistum TaxID=593909 RepID=UPI00333803C1